MLTCPRGRNAGPPRGSTERRLHRLPRPRGLARLLRPARSGHPPTWTGWPPRARASACTSPRRRSAYRAAPPCTPDGSRTRLASSARSRSPRGTICMAARFRRAGYRTVLCGRLMISNDAHWIGFVRQIPARRYRPGAAGSGLERRLRRQTRALGYGRVSVACLIR